MGLSRRFLNLIVNDHIPGFKSLRCIDLTTQRFFYPGTPPPPPPLKGDGSGASSAGGARDAATSRPPASKLKMERVFLPRPSFTFRPGYSDANDESRIHCFPLEDRKVICSDKSGRSFVFDAETGTAGSMPALRNSPGAGSVPELHTGQHACTDFAVLSGVEVVPCVHDDRQAGDDGGGNEKATKLRMIRHKSRRLHGGGGAIDTMF